MHIIAECLQTERNVWVSGEWVISMFHAWTLIKLNVNSWYPHRKLNIYVNNMYELSWTLDLDWLFLSYANPGWRIRLLCTHWTLEHTQTPWRNEIDKLSRSSYSNLWINIMHFVISLLKKRRISKKEHFSMRENVRKVNSLQNVRRTIHSYEHYYVRCTM